MMSSAILIWIFQFLTEMIPGKQCNYMMLSASFTGKGKRLSGFVPEIGRLTHADKKGHIYAVVSDPFPQVRCYEVIINK